MEFFTLWEVAAVCFSPLQGVSQHPSAATIADMKNLNLMLLLFAVVLVDITHADVQLNLIELPPGFSIEIYAEGVENARQMVRGDHGTIFAGSRRAGKLWAITDADGDQSADKVRLIDDDLNMPSGVEFMNGALLVSDDKANVIYRISYKK